MCQRSSQCPMCWQNISLKDPSSQELLDAVEHERDIRMNPPRNTTIFHHPALGDFELQHLPVNASESELQERIIQHLAAAAAMGRARHIARREGQRSRSSQGRPHFLVFPSHPNEASTASSLAQRDGSASPPEVITPGTNSPFITGQGDSAHHTTRPSSAQSEQHMTTAASASGSSAVAYQHGISSSNRSPAQTSPSSQDRAGPSDFQSFSDSLKSRLGALSTRYKDSITKSTRGWKERLFARNSPTPEVHGEAVQGSASDPGIPTISRMMDHLQVSEVSRTNASNIVEDTAERPSSNEDDTRAPTAAGSASN
ncbi:hypothetical protein ACS0TY_026227 [Phlomoides rotata]